MKDSENPTHQYQSAISEKSLRTVVPAVHLQACEQGG